MATVQDVPQVPSVSNTVYNPDQLIAGQFPLVTGEQVTLISGAGALLRGTILGRITAGAATSAVKASGANTGNGTFVIDVTTPTLAGAVPGIYTLRCIEAVVNGGKFELKSPTGQSLGVYIIPAGAGNNIAIANQIKGVLTDAATDFIVGDGFDITVPAGSGKMKPAVKTALDGSAVPVAILTDDVDATAADKKCGVYLTGMFNKNALIKDASYTLAELEVLMRPLSIFFRNSVSNANPT